MEKRNSLALLRRGHRQGREGAGHACRWEPFLPLRMGLTLSPFWVMEKQTPLSLFIFPSPSPLSSQFLPPPALNTKGSCSPLTAQGLQSPDTGPACGGVVAGPTLWAGHCPQLRLIQSCKHQRVKSTRKLLGAHPA